MWDFKKDRKLEMPKETTERVKQQFKDNFAVEVKLTLVAKHS